MSQEIFSTSNPSCCDDRVLGTLSFWSVSRLGFTQTPYCYMGCKVCCPALTAPNCIAFQKAMNAGFDMHLLKGKELLLQNFSLFYRFFVFGWGGNVTMGRSLAKDWAIKTNDFLSEFNLKMKIHAYGCGDTAGLDLQFYYLKNCNNDYNNNNDKIDMSNYSRVR